MSRIVVTSDLHLGITSEATLRSLAGGIADEQPALTVLAGDLGEPLANFHSCLRLFADLPGEVAVLAGNHDVWARVGHSSQELWERLLPDAVRGMGMLWLEEGDWRRGDLAVVGSLAWYDYSAVDPGVPPYAPEDFAARKGGYNLDGRFVDWAWTDPEFAARLGDGLCERLERLAADASVRAIVVVTHVPLFEEQLSRRPYDPRWSFSNAYFGNLTLGQRVAEVGKVRRVVSGHTHVGREGRVSRRARRDDGELPDIHVSVIASDYDAPVYLVVDETELGTTRG